MSLVNTQDIVVQNCLAVDLIWNRSSKPALPPLKPLRLYIWTPNSDISGYSWIIRCCIRVSLYFVRILNVSYISDEINITTSQSC